MKTSIAWSPAVGLNVVSVERGQQAWTVSVHSRQPTFCPGCGARSESRHSTYWRTLWDLSAQGTPVVISARLGRWKGVETRSVIGRISPSALRNFAAPFACRTARMAGIVRLLGHSAGGRPVGAADEQHGWHAGQLHDDSDHLEEVRRARSENGAAAAVRVAGVDDWAWRKGHNYGTIIVDLERREVVEVLADRSAATTASWFKDHPGRGGHHPRPCWPLCGGRA